LLSKLLEYNGWRVPLSVSKLSGYLIRGHGRLYAAQALNQTLVPVDYQDYGSEADERADLVADNEIAALAKMNNEILAKEIAELDSLGFDLDLTGITEARIKKLLKNAEPVAVKPEVEFTEELHEASNYLVLYFDNDIDWLQALTLFELKTVKALDSREGFEKKGIGRVVNGPAALNRIDEILTRITPEILEKYLKKIQ
jgi:hypothetical protein